MREVKQKVWDRPKIEEWQDVRLRNGADAQQRSQEGESVGETMMSRAWRGCAVSVGR